ncbi:hypothetical protein J2X75_005953 [Paenibacillus sp. 2003]|nr:hypothetical protein [Paenibacillus sp. 2003]
MMGEPITYGGSEPIKVQKDWGSFLSYTYMWYVCFKHRGV